MPQFKRLYSIALCAVLAACSGDGASGGTSASGGAAADTPVAKLAQLEDSGAIPKLDRSDSLAGPDADNNGIRDDIDAYIAKQPYATDPKKRAAVSQLARAMQKTLLVDITDMLSVKETNRQRTHATYCVYLRFKNSAGYQGYAQVSTEIESITTNTKQRLKAYLAFSAALDGTVWTLPQGDTCDE